MAPVRSRIFDAIETRLGLLAPRPTIERLPPGEPDPAAFPLLVLDDEGDLILAQDWHRIRARLSFALLGMVSGDGAEAHRAAIALDAAALALLMADPQLGGLCGEILPGALALEPAQASGVRCVAFRRAYSVEYDFRTTDPAN